MIWLCNSKWCLMEKKNSCPISNTRIWKCYSNKNNITLLGGEPLCIWYAGSVCKAEWYKSKINLNFSSSFTNTSGLLYGLQMWQQCLFSVRQLLNQYTICCAKLLIPSEMTWMLRHLVLFFFFSSTAPPTVRIIHSGHACNVEEERHTERVYTIREGETLELTCLVTGHPRPQVRNSSFGLPLTDRVDKNSDTRESWDKMLIWCLCFLPVCFFCPHSPSAACLLILH